MNKNLIFFIISIITFANILHAQISTDKPTPNKNSKLSIIFPFDDVNSAIRGNQKASPWNICLNGEWKMKSIAKSQLNPNEVFTRNIAESELIPVIIPSIDRANEADEITNVPGNVNIYRKYFPLSETAFGREVFIGIEGTYSPLTFWINGKQVGKCAASDTFETVEITPYVKFAGMNLICIEMEVKNTDYKGINGSIYIYSKPPVCFSKLMVESQLTPNNNGKVNIKVDIKNAHLEMNTSAIITAYCYSPDNKELFVSDNTQKIKLKTGKSIQLNFNKEITKPIIWTDEKPMYYIIVLALKDKEGSTEVITSKIKFDEK